MRITAIVIYKTFEIMCQYSLSHLLDINVFCSVISPVFYDIKCAHNINSFVDPRGGLLDSVMGARSEPIKRKDDVSSESLISLCDNCINNINLNDIADLAMIVIDCAGLLQF